ncbi:MAG: hypothetical protein Q7S17_00910 [Xanthobacteraceae bacterium]|nr:hypothetical protein [Xanthobacteraceae bacterium]
MAITTYAQLKTAMENWSERTDFSAREAEFIALGEAEIKRDLARFGLRLREMVTRTSLTPSSGAATLPTDFMTMITVQARESAPRRLEYKTQDWLDEAYPDGDSSPPSFYTLIGGSLYMYPLTTSDIRITYYAYPAALSDAATTNWLLTKYPDVYLWASLKQAEIWASNVDGVAKYNGLYTGALEGLKSAAFGAAMTPGTSRSASQAAQ